MGVSKQELMTSPASTNFGIPWATITNWGQSIAAHAPIIGSDSTTLTSIQSNGFSAIWYLFWQNEEGNPALILNNGNPANPNVYDPVSTTNFLLTNFADSTTPATGGGITFTNAQIAQASQIMASLPVGSIGRIYMACTSAATADALGLDVPSLGFGAPFVDMANTLSSLGGTAKGADVRLDKLLDWWKTAYNNHLITFSITEAAIVPYNTSGKSDAPHAVCSSLYYGGVKPDKGGTDCTQLPNFLTDWGATQIDSGITYPIDPTKFNAQQGDIILMAKGNDMSAGGGTHGCAGVMSDATNFYSIISGPNPTPVGQAIVYGLLKDFKTTQYDSFDYWQVWRFQGATTSTITIPNHTQSSTINVKHPKDPCNGMGQTGLYMYLKRQQLIKRPLRKR